MKKVSLKKLNKVSASIMLGLFAVNLNAQNGPPWKPTGNAASSGDFVGTTNGFPLLVKTNNVTRFTFDSNGDIIFNSLANSMADRILSIDANGKLSALSGNGLASVLTNNGIGVLQKTGSDYYLPSGNLGIGIAPSPGISLDVIGNVRISQNLLVGGGIITTDVVQANTQIKGFDFKVDNDLNVTGSSSFTGTSTFKGNLVASNGIDFGNAFGMKSGLTDGNGNNFLQVGKIQGQILPLPPVCPGSASNMWWMSNYGGYISQALGANQNPSNPMNASLSMWTDWINGNGHIEAQGINNNSTANALLINYYCGRDVGINNGPNGGNVVMGGSSNHSIGMFSPTKIRTYDVNALRIENPNNNKTTFYVSTGGKTIIGEQTQTTGSHNNAILTVNGKTVAKEIIVTQQNWADYVFAKNYSLMNLDKLEAYINANKHLPNVPSAKEIDKDGLNLGEMNKIQMEKIEELTLYVIELKKELEILKKNLKQ